MLTRQHLLQMISVMGGVGDVVYVSVPITSGIREVDLMDEYGLRSVTELRQNHCQVWLQRVRQPNDEAAEQATTRVRARFPNQLVLDPSRLEVVGWTQGDYTLLWKEVIERFVKTLVLADDWVWSRGARFEAQVAIQLGIRIEDERGRSLDVSEVGVLLDEPIDELRLRNWSSNEIRQYFPTYEASDCTAGAAAEIFEWLAAERSYQVKKFGTELDDIHTNEGFMDDAWWPSQLGSYFHRAHVLGLDLPVGRQALAKYVATACGLLESVVRTRGHLPPPGVSSGSTDGE